LTVKVKYVDVVISPHFRNLFFMATTWYGIYYFSTFKIRLFHVRQGLGGKLSDFYIFYCMVIELDIGSTFYAKLMCFWWLLKIKKIDVEKSPF
jgi:hypothetical protein